MNVSLKLSLMKRMTRFSISTCCRIRESHVEVTSDAPCCGWAFAGNHMLGLRGQLRINSRELHQNNVVASLGNSIRTNCLKKKKSKPTLLKADLDMCRFDVFWKKKKCQSCSNPQYKSFINLLKSFGLRQRKFLMKSEHVIKKGKILQLD